MTQVTSQSVTATPGRRHSFSAKTPAAGAKGTGPFTELSVTATPGGIHTFTAKDPADGGAKGAGPFTAQSVMATPGGLRTFVAKDGVVTIIPPVKGAAPVSGSSGTNVGDILTAQHRKRLIREDDEVLAMIMAAMETLF